MVDKNNITVINEKRNNSNKTCLYNEKKVDTFEGRPKYYKKRAHIKKILLLNF